MDGEPSQHKNDDPQPSVLALPRALTDPAYFRSICLAFLRGEPPFFSDEDSDSSSDDGIYIPKLVAPLRVPLLGEAENPIIIEDDDPPSDVEVPEVIDPEVPPCGRCTSCERNAPYTSVEVPPEG